MKLSLNWLNDYVDLGDRGPETVAEDLTSIGREVETIESQGGIDDKVIVAQIQEAVPHPMRISCAFAPSTQGAMSLCKSSAARPTRVPVSASRSRKSVQCFRVTLRSKSPKAVARFPSACFAVGANLAYRTTTMAFWS